MDPDICTSKFPTCPAMAPKGYDGMVWCAKSGQRDQYTTWYFEYNSCSRENTARLTNDDDYFTCTCINNISRDCRAIMCDNESCERAFQGIYSLQMIIALLALVLNILICFGFRQKDSMRKKNSNILLLNQALVDIFSTICALPNAIFLLLQSSLKAEPSYMYPTAITMLILSASSNIFLFVVIATERFLSLYKPIWHRSNVNSRIVWKAIAVAWFVSLLLTAVVPITQHPSNQEERDQQFYLYRLFLFALLGVLLILITTLHVWSFVLAYRAVYTRERTSQQHFLQSKKQLRLLLIFIAMYIAFLVAFVTLQVMAILDSIYFSIQNQVLLCVFTTTSLLNPVITLCLKPAFRLQFSKQLLTVD